MKVRLCRWGVFVMCGGYGWYQNIVAMGWVDEWLPDWLSVVLFFVAIGGGVWAGNHIGREIEGKARQVVAGWWKDLHGNARARRQEKAIKWLLVPVILWMLPLLLGAFGMATRF